MTCWVALPLKPSAEPDRWSLGSLPFVLTAGSTVSPRLLREGTAPLAELPAAERLVLVMPSADVLILAAAWPHLDSLPVSRLREALANLLEESLIQPVDQCHFALAPRPVEPQERTVAVVDRAWMRFVHDAFSRAGFAHHEILPAQLLQPEETLLTFEAHVGQADAPGLRQTVLSWRGKGSSGWGLRWDPNEAWSGQLALPEGVVPQAGGGLRAWALSGLGAGAFNLRQFEFAAPLAGLWERVRPWRAALVLLAAALLLQVLFLNVYWMKLVWQKRSLEQGMRTLVRDTLPNAPADIAPAIVLKRALENLRVAQGATSPGEFPVLAARLAALLANEPADTLQQLDYRDDSLLVRFKPGYGADALAKRAGAQGLVFQDQGRGLWRLSGSGR
ncbi:MAG: hypothetical protein KGL63_12165 [Betaproteobacteria bacterium]|nr:hypothetical protein [Betaproteobacteria bacterium]